MFTHPSWKPACMVDHMARITCDVLNKIFTITFFTVHLFVVFFKDLFNGLLSSEKLCLILDSSSILSTDLLVSEHAQNIQKMAKPINFINLNIFV